MFNLVGTMVLKTIIISIICLIVHKQILNRQIRLVGVKIDKSKKLLIW